MVVAFYITWENWRFYTSLHIVDVHWYHSELTLMKIYERFTKIFYFILSVFRDGLLLEMKLLHNSKQYISTNPSLLSSSISSFLINKVISKLDIKLLSCEHGWYQRSLGEKQNTCCGTKISCKFSYLLNKLSCDKIFLVNADVHVNINILWFFFLPCWCNIATSYSSVTKNSEILDWDVLLISSCLTHTVTSLLTLHTLR